MIANRNGNESLNIFPIKLNFEIKVKYWTLLTTNQRTIQQDQMTSCRWVLANTEAIFTKTKKRQKVFRTDSMNILQHLTTTVYCWPSQFVVHWLIWKNVNAENCSQ